MYMSYSNPPFQLNRPFELLPRQDDAAEPVFKLYHYDPTIAGAVIFVLLFVGTTGFHFYQLWRARTWFMIPLMLGGIRKSPQDAVSSAILLLQAGITARTPQHPRYMSLRRRSLQEANLANSPAQWNLWATQAEPGQDLRVHWTLPPYIIQALLILVAPALFAATIYMELGRIVTLVDGDSYTLIRKKWLTKMFVCGDVLSFMVQSAGECNAK